MLARRRQWRSIGGSDGYALRRRGRRKRRRQGHRAARKNRPGIVNAKDANGDTALIVAIRDRDEDWTGFLLNKGADPNLAGKSGDTPLIAAARVGFEDAAGWLLGLGAKVDGTNRMGETALIIAVQQRQPRDRQAAARRRRQSGQDRFRRGLFGARLCQRATLASREILQADRGEEAQGRSARR